GTSLRFHGRLYPPTWSTDNANVTAGQKVCQTQPCLPCRFDSRTAPATMSQANETPRNLDDPPDGNQRQHDSDTRLAAPLQAVARNGIERDNDRRSGGIRHDSADARQVARPVRSFGLASRRRLDPLRQPDMGRTRGHSPRFRWILPVLARELRPESLGTADGVSFYLAVSHQRTSRNRFRPYRHGSVLQ